MKRWNTIHWVWDAQFNYHHHGQKMYDMTGPLFEQGVSCDASISSFVAIR